MRIPFLSRTEDGKPLQDAIDFAAERTACDSVAVAQVMSLFFEAIADEVSRGKVVRIPGFGIFAPVAVSERDRRMSRDLTPRCKPAFSPSRGFRQQVRYGAPPNASGAERLKRFDKNHSSTKGRGAPRVWAAMEAMRDQIDAQLARTRDVS
ncbi:MAG: HU family DNA-binding protein [Planctomycetota bacterium]